MPKDIIQRAIDKATANEGDDYNEVRYEGFGPGGVSLIVETLTDNTNRTVTNVRTIFSKNGGNMGESGSVAHGKQLVLFAIRRHLDSFLNGRNDSCQA